MLKGFQTGLLIAMLAVMLNMGLTTNVDAQQRLRDRYRARLLRVDANVGARSKADFVRRQDRLKFNVEGRFLAPEFVNVDVYLNGTFVASAPIIDGFFKLEMDSRRGDPVPDVEVGDTVTVTDQATGSTLFEGTMRPKL